MDTKRGADELASRCVALVVYHQHARRRRPDKGGIDAEFRAVALEASRGGIPASAIVAEVLAELRARYEPEMAGRLHREFVAGFSGGIRIDLVPA